MFGRTRSALAAAVAVLGLAVGAASAASTGAAPRATEQVVVVFERGVSASERAAVRAAADTRPVRALGRDRFQLVTPEPGQSVHEAVAALRDSPAVAAADPNVTFEPSSVPNDARFAELWGLRNTGQNVGGFSGAVPGADIDATLAWDRTVGDPSVVLADIDTGYLFGHPDLGPVAWTNPGEIPGDGIDNDSNGYVDDRRGWDTADQDNDPTDVQPWWFIEYLPSLSHGVHTAGTMGARGNDATGVTGVAQDVRIMPIRVGSNAGGFTLASIVEAMNYAGANGARAANMSLNASGVYPTILAAQAANQETLFVVAAGNNGTDNEAQPRSPCGDPTTAVEGYTPPPGTIDNVVCVTATDQADQLATFSNVGNLSVDLGAPGTETLSTMRETELAFSADFESGGFADWTTPVPPADSDAHGFVVGARGMAIGTGAIEAAGAQQPGTTHATQTPAIPVAPGAACTLRFITYSFQNGDDQFSWELFLDGVKLTEAIEPAAPPTAPIRHTNSFVVPSTTPPHTVTVRFVFHRGLAGAPDALAVVFGGLDLRLDCLVPTYGYLQGTSMATPHVTGTAGLLFSLKPTAAVTQVRSALLAGVDPLESLAGKTATGGRLNAWKALATLVPMDTRIKSGPPRSDKSTNATFTFDTNDTGNAGFECRLDAGPFGPCSSPQSYRSLAAGKHTFRVRSAVSGGVDTTPAIAEWTVAKSK